MAKDFIKGDSYSLYRNTGSYGTPTWVKVLAVGDLAVDVAPADIEVPVRGLPTGHLQGDGDPTISFTLYEDAGDAGVTALVDAMHDGDLVHLAVARGNAKPYWHMECVLTGVGFSASRGEPAAWEVEAKRHANSDYGMVRAASFTGT